MSSKPKDKSDAVNQTPPKIEEKSVKHVFSPEERNEIGINLARAIGTSRNLEAEFDGVRASYKAKIEEAKGRIDNLSTTLVNGFEFKTKRCMVLYFPKERKKHYFLEGTEFPSDVLVEPVLVEDMTADDYQADLIQVESKFDCHEEIEIFPAVDNDRGIIAIGKLTDRWFTALRIKIGKQSIDERLDNEQPSVKQRPDAVNRACDRASEWMKTALGKEVAKGFDERIKGVIESHKEREE